MPNKAKPVKNDAPGMRGPRSRNVTGDLRKKRADTLVGSIEKEYGVDLEVRSDMKLETLRKRLGDQGIKKLIKDAKNK